jgi:hypothetical protein
VAPVVDIVSKNIHEIPAFFSAEAKGQAIGVSGSAKMLLCGGLKM